MCIVRNKIIRISSVFTRIINSTTVVHSYKMLFLMRHTDSPSTPRCAALPFISTAVTMPSLFYFLAKDTEQAHGHGLCTHRHFAQVGTTTGGAFGLWLFRPSSGIPIFSQTLTFFTIIFKHIIIRFFTKVFTGVNVFFTESFIPRIV